MTLPRLIFWCPSGSWSSDMNLALTELILLWLMAAAEVFRKEEWCDPEGVEAATETDRDCLEDDARLGQESFLEVRWQTREPNIVLLGVGGIRVSGMRSGGGGLEVNWQKFEEEP